MSKFIISLLKYILYLSIVYVILLIIWGELIPIGALKKNLNYRIGSYGHMFSRIQEIRYMKNLDILFLGSSHAYRGFDTRIFKNKGLNTFNLGSSAQTPIQTKVLLKRYLQLLNPKLIIYEVYPATILIDGVESSLDIIANDKNDFESIKMAFEVNNIKVYNTLIYGFYKDWIGENNNYKEKAVKGADTYIKGGFVEKRMKYYEYHKYEYDTNKWEFNKDQIKSFETVISFIKSIGIPVILVQAPITKSEYYTYSNNEEFDDLMRAHGIYYNFNKILELDDRLHFYDSNHLNRNGVSIFNEKLIEILSDRNTK
ncbi:ABC transporter ATP-binding protein [Candidatus Magnetoovum chiemensis]|nr:ABC transporter ATP-binding protein [Candidatus Magnetoovum chiemensis]